MPLDYGTPAPKMGETFTAQGCRWTVYRIDPDGTVCSRYAGEANPKPTIDYTQSCAFRGRSNVGTHTRRVYCDEYVVQGSRYCPKHQS